MSSPVRGTIVFGLSSVSSILLGLLVVKAWAHWLGPAGVGAAAALQGWISVAGALGGMGLAPALIQFGGEALGRNDPAGFAGLAALAWARWRRWAPLSALAVGAAAALASAAGGFGWGPLELGAVALGGLFNAAGTLQAAAVTARRLVASQVVVQVGGVLAGGVTSTSILAWKGPAAIPWAVLAQQAATWSVAAFARGRRGLPAPGPVDPVPFRSSALWLGFSMVPGMAVVNLLPSAVLALAGKEIAGYWRAASLVGLQAFQVLGNGLAQDFQPRLARVRGDRAAFQSALGAQFRLSVGLAALGGLLTIPISGWVIRAALSKEFLPAQPILDWMMVGGILRIASWCFAFVVLVGASPRRFLLLEIAGSSCWALGSLAGLRLGGAPGLGLGFAAAYAAYLIVAALACRDLVGWPLGLRRVLGLLAALATGICLLALKAGGSRGSSPLHSILGASWIPW